jgi:DNA-binding response OmpR family regulator
MSETETKDSGENKAQDAAAGGVADYLAAPKKKQKSYVVIATAGNVSEEDVSAITRYVQGLGKQYLLARPKNPEELARQVSRQIHLMVLDDSFAPRERLLKLVRFMKEKKTADGLPVLFLTREAAAMTAAYRKELFAHQENDDYLDMKGIGSVELLARVKQSLEFRNRRRSRRFRVSLPVVFQFLGEDRWRKGKLVDVSLHGALLASTENDLTFDLKSQIRLQVPVADLFDPSEGEVFRLSGVVRRLSITGSSAGLSFEHVTERQLTMLTTFVTALAAKYSTSHEVNNTIVTTPE